MTEPDPREFKLLGPDNNVIAHGSMSAVTEPILDSKARADATGLLIDAARACGLIENIEQREDALRAGTVQRLLDRIAEVNERIDAFVTRREEMAREDAEREAQQVQNMLDALPDPDAPEPTHHPGGELSIVAPSRPRDRAELRAMDQGTLPKELLKGAPPPTGTSPEPDPNELGDPKDPKQVPQPIAISLNAEDV